MPLSRVEKLEKINAALMERVERSMDQQGNAFSLFQTAIGLESRMRARTDELAATLRRLELSNRAFLKAKEAAEVANISKTRFLAAASHDVLQPLNAASLCVSALGDLQTTERGRQLVRQVEQSLATMDELLRTLLDISKLDSGVMRPDIEAVPLGAVLSGLRSDFEPIAVARGLRFTVRPSAAHVLTDRIMLRRILLNIVSNAIRYTRGGGVLIGARRRGGMMRIDVADTGIGIPPGQHEAIFEEFHRGALPPAGDIGCPGGLGLGLSIVRRMATALGHEIAFTSAEGRGTVFRLHVPVAETPGRSAQSTELSPARPAARGLSGVRVLVVENDRRVMEAMMALLDSWHCSVRLASQTEEALEVLRDTGWCPDIILADQHLDSGDLGIDTIAQARGHLGRTVPAVIITADAADALAEAARDMGIELMRKPLRPAELRALMAHLAAMQDKSAPAGC